MQPQAIGTSPIVIQLASEKRRDGFALRPGRLDHRTAGGFGRHDGRVCDICALPAHSGYQPTVVRVRKEGLDAGALAALLQAVWPDVEEALTAGAMVTVTDRAIRVRRLPIVKR